MSSAEPRPGLGARRQRRPHPALPQSVTERSEPTSTGAPEATPTDLHPQVMLCVRVSRSLRQRFKLVALQTGRSVQDLVAEAIETECRRHGV